MYLHIMLWRHLPYCRNFFYFLYVLILTKNENGNAFLQYTKYTAYTLKYMTKDLLISAILDFFHIYYIVKKNIKSVAAL